MAAAVDAEITRLGIEHDEQGNRAKAYLYCLEARCPETGWWVPLAPSWVISRTRRVIARLKPDHAGKRFDIEIVSGVSEKELKAAERGTVQDGEMVYQLDGKTYRTPIKTLRGDYRLPDGSTANRLRRWEKTDFKPRPDDIFQERLYCIQWIRRGGQAEGRPPAARQETFFAAPTGADMERERRVEAIVAGNLARWQAEGLVPDMPIEPGEETTRLFRERGWTYWHHLFNARQLLSMALTIQEWRTSQVANVGWINIAKMLNFYAKLCQWLPTQGEGGPKHVFYNQALNVLQLRRARLCSIHTRFLRVK